MKGAHCLDCLERGPDLLLEVRAPAVPVGCGELVFRCAGCGVAWRWRLRLEADRIVYEFPMRLGEAVA